MAQWMVRRGDVTFGPVSAQNLQQKAASGELLPTDQIKQQGQMEWRAASSVRGIQFRTVEPEPAELVEVVEAANHGMTATASPMPPPFRANAIEKRSKVSTTTILGVGGTVLLVALLSLGAWRYFSGSQSPRPEDLLTDADEQDTLLVVRESPEDAKQSLEDVVAAINNELVPNYVEESLYLGVNCKKCYEEEFFLPNARAAATSAATERIGNVAGGGGSRIQQLQDDLDLLLGEFGFLAAKARVEIVQPVQIDDALEGRTITFEVRVKLLEFTESAPREGEIIEACRQQFLAEDPTLYRATVEPKQAENGYVVNSQQVNGPLGTATIKDLIRRNVASLLSLNIPPYAKQAVIDAI